MSLTQTEDIELVTRAQKVIGVTHHNDELDANEETIPATAVDAISDGGYGWTVVFTCSVISFFINGWTGSWGVMQTALLRAYPNQGSTTSLSFVGSLGIALCVAFGLASVRLSRLISAKYNMLIGVLLMGLGPVFGSFALNNLGGLFGTVGLAFGIGSSMTFSGCTTLPVQWFSSKLGTANGLIKLGGGVGATVMAIASQELINKVGIPWTFRIFGLLILAIGIPAALMVKERAPAGTAPFVDLSLFKSLPFTCIFLAGATGVFALFVPPYFLPLFANSIGLSPSTGAGIVAAFNACGAVGRFAAGLACDRYGSVNVLFLTVALNAISTLAIWPVSSSVGPLVLFAALNGMSNGAFFVAMPTAIGRMVPGQAAVGVGMAVTGWTGGYLMGSPIAGILITATGAESSRSASAYRAAIFYAGGISLASTAFVLVARLWMDPKVMKKL